MGGPGSGRKKGSGNKTSSYKSEYMNIMTKGTKSDPLRWSKKDKEYKKRLAKALEDTPVNRKKWKLANQRNAIKQKEMNKKK
jgi:hypothetical protein